MKDVSLIPVSLTANENNLYEYDFYPDRKFDAEVYIHLYTHEGWGNIEFFNLFERYDKQNIKVIAFTPLNFFPIASLVSHKCIMLKTDLLSSYKRKTHFNMLDQDKYVKFYNIPRLLDTRCKGIIGGSRQFVIRDKNNRSLAVNSEERVFELFDFFKDKPICVNESSLKKFDEIQLEENKICIEIGKRYHWFSSFVDKMSVPDVVGLGMQFQIDLIKNHDAHADFLTFQMLLSLRKGWRYIGHGGAGCLFASTPCINTMLLLENNANMNKFGALFKSLFNRKIFGTDTRYLNGGEHNTQAYVETITQVLCADRRDEWEKLYAITLELGFRAYPNPHHTIFR